MISYRKLILWSSIILISCKADHEIDSSEILDASTKISTSEKADLILYNAQIITMGDPFHPEHYQQAIAIKKNKILDVGSDRDILKLNQPTKTKTVDMKGRVIMPGIVDAHSHYFNTSELTYDEAQETMIRKGITTVGQLYADEDIISQLYGYEKRLRVRTNVYMAKTTAGGEVLDDWYLAYPPTRLPGEMLRINGIKIFADGGSVNCPATSVERFIGCGLGDLYHTQDALENMMLTAKNGGYQIAVHAIGDRAISQTLNAFETILGGESNKKKHRIEHNGVLTQEIISKYGSLGIIPVIFGYKLTCKIPDTLDDFFKGTENAYRSLMDQNPNLPVAWHGDDPIVESPYPFVDMSNLITRIDNISVEGPCLPPAWLAKETLTVKQALRIMTLGSSYALDRDQEVGSLVPGKFADLIVISDNPLNIAQEKIKNIQVLATMINGKVEYSKFPDESELSNISNSY